LRTALSYNSAQAYIPFLLYDSFQARPIDTPTSPRFRFLNDSHKPTETPSKQIKMSENTNPKTPNPLNPSSLKPRYEIRKLEPEQKSWIKAIITHCNLFRSPLFSVLYSENVTDRVHEIYAKVDYLVEHQVDSGMSFGVFDTEYKLKREESKATGGKLYWNSDEKGVQATEGFQAEGVRLLEQMDFPLVSIALAYDAFNPLDMEKMSLLMASLPHFGLVYNALSSRDARDPLTWAPTGQNQVLLRAATATRSDYEGEGIMSGMARWLMREADTRGFRAIQIECVHDAVHHVWSNPPAPYKGTVVCEFQAATYKDENGAHPFQPADVGISKLYIELAPKA
jgi:hypothetical protein